MVVSIQTCALVGLESNLVSCEVDLSLQLPTFTLVGLPSSMTQESRERIRAAIVNSGFDWPARKITINMLPANLPKWGSHFELAMGLGILGAADELSFGFRAFALGELSLSGEVRPCGWLAAVAPWLLEHARETLSATGEPLLLLVHDSDARQLLLARPAFGEVCEIVGVRSLKEAYVALAEAARRVRTAAHADAEGKVVELDPHDPYQTLAAVKHEPLGAIAALVAIAGRHHCLFAGPHGMGKSMLIRAICEAKPRLAVAEREERSSVLRSFGEHFGSWRNRPAVHLQTSISRAALEGAVLTTGQVLPGELTRAHLGLLVADEFLEFRRDVIEALRQPLDEGLVRLQRAKFRTALPAKFQFLASTNLCACGNWGTGKRKCRCGPRLRAQYQQKLSGPMLDRFDLIVTLGQRGQVLIPPDIPTDLCSIIETLNDSSTWAERVAAATSTSDRSGEGAADFAELWSEVSHDGSDRVRLKLAQVASTLGRLLGEARQVRHLRLAVLLREDLERSLQDQKVTLSHQSLKKSMG